MEILLFPNVHADPTLHHRPRLPLRPDPSPKLPGIKNPVRDP